MGSAGEGVDLLRLDDEALGKHLDSENLTRGPEHCRAAQGEGRERMPSRIRTCASRAELARSFQFLMWEKNVRKIEH